MMNDPISIELSSRGKFKAHIGVIQFLNEGRVLLSRAFESPSFIEDKQQGYKWIADQLENDDTVYIEKKTNYEALNLAVYLRSLYPDLKIYYIHYFLDDGKWKVVD